jgi:DNA topoisomerase-1
MDNAGRKTAHAGGAGVSIRNGPVLDDHMDTDAATNGNSKRKARTSTSKAINYNDAAESDSDAVPLVGQLSFA